MEGIQVSIERAGIRNDISVIKVGGYIDTTTSSEIERALDSLLKNGIYKVIIDLGNVDYISSAGWGIFISEIKGIRLNGGDLKLAKMAPDVYEVFELLEFHHILKAYDSLQKAIGDFDEGKLEGPPIVPPSMSRAPASTSYTAAETYTSPPKESTPERQTPATPKLKEDTLADAVKKIVSKYPEYGAWRIRAMLRDSFSVGWFEVRRVLKKLNLDSRSKRRRFAKGIEK
jgi:anti-sigma B factor antagonist